MAGTKETSILTSKIEAVFNPDHLTLLRFLPNFRALMKQVFIVLCFTLLLTIVSRLQGAESAPAHRSQRVWMTNDTSVFVIHIPTQKQRFSTWRKVNPIWWFGNADEPVAPDWYRPDGHFRTLMWHLRNPFHNFDCYVIGLSDKRFIRAGRFPEETFNPIGGWNWGACLFHGVRLPYVSYIHGRVRAYFGWRPGGAFGIELKLHSKIDNSQKNGTPRGAQSSSPGETTQGIQGKP